ncbi:MAG: isochorismatase [Candidatus Dojkabacteria bacterium]|nr:MAG: isochorismatase [Candidatus Dojkabacteria bacterium]
MEKAIVCIDFINEIVHPDGKLSGKGYADFVNSHGTLAKVKTLTEQARNMGIPVIWVAVQFDADYSNWPGETSPLFGAAKKFGALTEGTWATQMHEDVAAQDSDIHMPKHRVSAFSNPEFARKLSEMGVTQLYIAGVATDLAVASAVLDAHDMDFQVTVVTDASAAANDEDHQSALRQVAKVATLAELSKIQF